MPEELVVRHCAPTLACLKTANLFACPYASRKELYEDVRKLNLRLQGKGLRVLPLRYRNGVGLVYVYRPEKLKRDLGDEAVGCLLAGCGYSCREVCPCLKRLMERLDQDGEFPHEIGLFLGYPPEDVDGFMHKKGEAKLSGVWKVYENVDAARRTFELYRKCSDVYMKRFSEGYSIERLTVAV